MSPTNFKLLAEESLKHQVYESGEGFVSPPYENYRYYVGFLAGVRAALASKEVEHMREALLEHFDADEHVVNEDCAALTAFDSLVSSLDGEG